MPGALDEQAAIADLLRQDPQQRVDRARDARQGRMLEAMPAALMGARDAVDAPVGTGINQRTRSIDSRNAMERLRDTGRFMLEGLGPQDRSLPPVRNARISPRMYGAPEEAAYGEPFIPERR